jgi:undecaprenyl pyrophosphate phosphatase UppP
MQVLTLDQAQQLEGGGFWRGFICGFTAVATFAAITSPDPISKFAVYGLVMGWSACFA